MQLQRVAIAPSQRHEQTITLTAEQQHYLYRVLRLGNGDRFIAIDGIGQWWLAELQAEPQQAQILGAIAIQTELPVAVNLWIAMPKGNSMDEIVRQATELGVAQIHPVISDRTLLQPSAQKLTRWRRIAQEATEQSERQVIPALFEPLPWQVALANSPDPLTQRYLCVARGNFPHLLTQFTQAIAPANPTLQAIDLAVGPEGGWTEAEVAAAIAAGYQPVSLGDRILRSATAPLVAVALVASVLEAMSVPQKNV